MEREKMKKHYGNDIAAANISPQSAGVVLSAGLTHPGAEPAMLPIRAFRFLQRKIAAL
jgi:hypothetical protein